MHESNPPNQEISSAQEDLFIMAIENLKPLMSQPQVEAENLDVLDAEESSGSTIFVTTEASFRLGDKAVDVYIDQSTGVKDAEGGGPKTAKNFVLMVTEAQGQEGDKKIFTQKTYEVSGFTGPGYKESFFYIDTKTGEQKKMRTPDSLATSQDIARLDDGQLSHAELGNRIRERLEARQAFEEEIGEFSDRFTTERFSEAMAILDQLGPHNIEETELSNYENW